MLPSSLSTVIEGIREIVKRHGAGVTVTGFGTAFAVHFTGKKTLLDYRDTLADDGEQLRRFLLRGRVKVGLEWTLVCVSYNLKRMFTLKNLVAVS